MGRRRCRPLLGPVPFRRTCPIPSRVLPPPLRRVRTRGRRRGRCSATSSSQWCRLGPGPTWRRSKPCRPTEPEHLVPRGSTFLGRWVGVGGGLHPSSFCHDFPRRRSVEARSPLGASPGSNNELKLSPVVVY